MILPYTSFTLYGNPDKGYSKTSRFNISRLFGKSRCSCSPFKRHRQIFVTGHFEYNSETLKTEYNRDITKGLPIEVPENYYPENNPNANPIVKWRANANYFS